MAESIEIETLNSLADQMGSREALGRIVAMYTGKLPSEIDDLRSALDSGDLEGLQSAAHRLKSSSGQLGAGRLAVMLAGLEAVARDGDAEAAARILGEVTAEADLVRSELASVGS